MNYYSHHIGDYDSHTSHLSWFEDIAYRRLICLYYRTEKPISLDCGVVCRLIRANTANEKKAVTQVLKEFFTKMDDGYHSLRCDNEIKAYEVKAAKNKENGAKGGRPKKEPNDNPPETHWDSFGFENETQTKGNQSHKPEANSHEPIFKEQEHVNEDVHATVSKPEKYKDEIQNVFEHWKKVMNKRGTVILDSKRKSAIRARLADGYTQDQLCMAVNGCSMTDHNMGRTATNKTLYNDIEFICRNAPNVDRFIDTAGQASDGPISDCEEMVQVNIQDLPRPKPLTDYPPLSREEIKALAAKAIAASHGVRQ